MPIALAHVLRHRDVGHGGGVLDQRFHAAQRFGQREQPHARQQPEGLLPARPCTRNENVPPKPVICRRPARAAGGSPAPDGARARPCGCASSHAAIASALRLCASMRSASVLMPRSTRKQSNGAGAGAQRVLQEADPLGQARRHSPSTAPPTTSEWPLMYLVVECITMSTPQFERALEVRRQERVVADRDDAVLARDARHRLQVHQVHAAGWWASRSRWPRVCGSASPPATPPRSRRSTYSGIDALAPRITLVSSR